MATSPFWKVYDAAGKYEAACKSPETAAAVVSLLGHGATIKGGHGHIVWREGKERISAGDSYDVVAETCHKRWYEYNVKKHAQYMDRLANAALARSKAALNKD